MIYLVAVGKINAPYYKKAVDEYSKRLAPYAKLNVIEIDENRLMKESEKEILNCIAHEGKDILAKVKGLVIALDSRGHEMTSEGLADFIREKQTQGTADISFVIGGSYGLCQDVITRADLVLSFGRFTYPHQLMRVILTEQIYRAFSIINNSKYHK